MGEQSDLLCTLTQRNLDYVVLLFLQGPRVAFVFVLGIFNNFEACALARRSRMRLGFAAALFVMMYVFFLCLRCLRWKEVEGGLRRRVLMDTIDSVCVCERAGIISVVCFCLSCLLI